MDKIEFEASPEGFTNENEENLSQDPKNLEEDKEQVSSEKDQDSPPKSSSIIPQERSSPEQNQESPSIMDSSEMCRRINGYKTEGARIARNAALSRAKSSEKSAKTNLPRAKSALGSRFEASRMGSSNTKKEKLKSLFWKYADISDETGAIFLKSRQYVKLLQDSGILDNINVTRSKAEVTFASVSGRKGMTFDAFFQSLVKLAEMRYYDIYESNRPMALEQIVSKHLLPLCEIQSNDTSNIRDTSIPFNTLVYEPAVKAMLNSVYPVLKDIYGGYFGEPFKKARSIEQVAQIASKQLLTFVREFDLLKNYYVSKQTAISMLNTLVDTPENMLTNNPEDPNVFYSDNGGADSYFTLSRFFIFLFWIAVTGFETTKADSLQYTNAEKLYFLLAKMELSKGFAELSKIYFKHYSTPHSLLPSTAVVSKAVVNNPLYLRASSPNNKSITVTESQIIERPTNKTQEEEGDEKTGSKLAECTEKLQKIFMAYSSVNANSNTSKMTCFKFVTFLKDCGIIKSLSKTSLKDSLTVTEAELLFTKTLTLLNEKTGESSPLRGKKTDAEDSKRDKLDFKAFYCAVSQIAARFYPEMSMSHALIALFENNIKMIGSLGQSFDKSPTKMLDPEYWLSDPSIVEVKRYILKIVSLYFKSYTEDTIMEHDTFMRFCRDFGIFPELCNKATLHSIFYSLSYLHTGAGAMQKPQPGRKYKPMPSQAKKKVLKSGEYLDEVHFVDAIVLCALKSKAFEKEPTPLQKVLRFMEKILQSQGTMKVKKMIGKTRMSSDDIDPMFEMRIRYAKYFDRKGKTDHKQDLLDQVFPEDEINEFS